MSIVRALFGPSASEMVERLRQKLSVTAGQGSKPPEGWTRFDQIKFKGLCHTPGPWWRGPDGTEYCGTCYPFPWTEGDQARMRERNKVPL